ncbi:DUF7342 family protein [Salinigranum halophilum]
MNERVRTVMKRTYDPQSVATTAERVLTSETTARKHLGILTDDGIVEAVSLSRTRAGRGTTALPARSSSNVRGRYSTRSASRRCWDASGRDVRARRVGRATRRETSRAWTDLVRRLRGIRHSIRE